MALNCKSLSTVRPGHLFLPERSTALMFYGSSTGLGLLMCVQCTQSCLKGPACYHCTRVQPSVRWSLGQLLITLYWATEATALNDNSVLGNNQTLSASFSSPSLFVSIILTPFRPKSPYPFHTVSRFCQSRSQFIPANWKCRSSVFGWPLRAVFTSLFSLLYRAKLKLQPNQECVYEQDCGVSPQMWTLFGTFFRVSHAHEWWSDPSVWVGTLWPSH